MTKYRTDDGEMMETLSRYDEDELTVAVIQGLSSLGSTTAMGIVATAGLVSGIFVEKYLLTEDNILTNDQGRVTSVGIYLFKISNGKIRTMCEICLKLTIKTPERRQLRRYSVFIVNF